MTGRSRIRVVVTEHDPPEEEVVRETGVAGVPVITLSTARAAQVAQVL